MGPAKFDQEFSKVWMALKDAENEAKGRVLRRANTRANLTADTEIY